MAPSDFYTFWLSVLAVLFAGAVLSWSTVVGVPNDTSPHRQSYRDPAAIGLVVLAAVLLGLAIIPSAGWGFVDDVYFFYNYMLGRPVPPLGCISSGLLTAGASGRHRPQCPRPDSIIIGRL